MRPPRRPWHGLIVSAWMAALAFLPPDLCAQWSASVTAAGSAFSQDAIGPATPPGAAEALLAIGGQWSREWDGGRYVFAVAPLLRLDPSGERSRFDFVDLSATVVRNRWELSIGMREMVWGTVESRRLVDAVNQRDLEGGGNGFVRMGQLMADLTVFGRWGAIDLLLLPWFRERRFDGHSGQLWSPMPVDDSEAEYGPGASTRSLGWAVRWSRTVGPLDLGVSHLQGILREPGFIGSTNEGELAVLRPRYDHGSQTSVDAQAATGRWIWKLETLTADPAEGRYLAMVGGVEYGIGDFLGLFLEYAWDSRGSKAMTSFASDVFVGGRLFLPDGQIRVGTFVDARSANTVLTAAADWRIGYGMTLGMQANVFLGDEAAEPGYARRQHTCLTLRLSRYF